MERKRVMVVEDSPTQLIKLQCALEEEGFVAIGVASAEAALESFAEAQPDLVIVDYHLPRMQGDELCRQLRLNINTRGVPILMLTADTTSAGQLHGLEAGADDYVSKSEDTDILMLRVHALLRKAHVQDAIVKTEMSMYLGARVLIIDDSDTYLEFMASELGREGYVVDRASTGAQGLEMLAERSYDCVLVDLIMPQIDGVSVCKKLSEKRQLTDMPVVILMLSAHETKENVTRALEAGADDFVGKSSDLAIVKARVRALLRRKFILEQNRRIIDEFRTREMEALRARAEKEAAEAKAALAGELARTNDELAEANRKLREAQSQLVHSEKMASLGQLVAGIAHEINNPLSFVLSHVFSVESWLRGVLDRDGERLSPESMQRLERAVTRVVDMGRGLDRMKNLVVSLRTFSRLDEGDLASMDVNEAVMSVLLFLQHRTKDRVRIVTDFGPERMLTCRGGQLNQVLMNVIANAVDAIEDEGTITIATRCQDNKFLITVEDTGKGMPDSVRARIFDPFFTTKPVGQGTGLGLSISYGIVQAHKGRIEFESEVGKGTRATIEIPMNLRAVEGA